MKGLISAAAIVFVASLVQMSIPSQLAHAQSYSQADAAYFQYGMGWGKMHADQDWQNGYAYGTTQTPNQGPCQSGDFNCMFLWGDYWGYYQEWLRLSGR